MEITRFKRTVPQLSEIEWLACSAPLWDFIEDPEQPFLSCKKDFNPENGAVIYTTAARTTIRPTLMYYRRLKYYV